MMIFLYSKPKSEFFLFLFFSSSFNVEFEMDVEALKVYFTLTLARMQLINEKVSWRGGTEKTYESLQILIEALTTLESIVLHVCVFILSRCFKPHGFHC